MEILKVLLAKFIKQINIFYNSMTGLTLELSYKAIMGQSL
jgi:hypothetical protein